MKRHKTEDPCPCASGHLYADCCKKLHDGAAASSAEALMRSRYSAYARGLETYLLATWASDRRPIRLDLGSGPPTKWIGLEIMHHDREDADHATVEFIARCRINGKAERLHEISRFVRIDGRWLYLDGEQLEN